MYMKPLSDWFAETVSLPTASPFGVPALDGILPHAGVPHSMVTEVSGGFGTGRTSMMVQLAATALEDERCAVIVVDSKRGFTAERLKEALKDMPWACLVDQEQEIFTRFHRRGITVIQELWEFLTGELEHQIREFKGKGLSVIVLLIDNIHIPFRWFHETKPGEMIDAIRHTGELIRNATAEHHLYTLVSNGMKRKLDIEEGTRRLLREYYVPSLGKPWLDYIDTRIILERPQGSHLCIARVTYCWCREHQISKKDDQGERECLFECFGGRIKS